MKKMEMPVGQKVRGYGLLNEYGEFEFIPEQTGLRMGQTKLLKQGDNYTLSTTKKFVIVHVRLDKANGMKIIVNLMQAINNVVQTLRNYEF